MRVLPIAALFVSLIAQTPAQVHPTPMAGHWFPAEALSLGRLLDSAYSASERRVPGPARRQLLALVVPHAGLQYSGVVAAAAYRLVPKPANVILLGFSHRYPFAGVAAPKVDSFSMPLGQIKVNREALTSLGFREIDEKAVCDHSLENQLPFLQRSAAQASLIPLYVGALDKRSLEAAARKLARRLRQGDVLIASSDFTHYGSSYGHTPFPNDSKLPGRLRERANEAFERIGSLDVPLFDRFLAETGDTICGRDPVRLLMATLAALPEDVYMSPTDYMTSGELSGDHSISVGYGALAFYPASSYTVASEEQQQLLAGSRNALDRHLTGAGHGASLPPATTPDLQQRTGVFVTIRKKNELRGCIGALSPKSALPDTVADRTVAAARSDPRFPPLLPDEGPVQLEISLLTPLKRLPDWRAYRGGLGAVLLHEGRAGLLLPQVAEEMKWNRRQFLEGLSRKAGLEPRAYRSLRARLYVFAAQVFAERSDARPGDAQ